MAKGNGVPLATGVRIASRVLGRLAPWCARVALAGSVRRLRPTVHDVDLVVQPQWMSTPELVRAARKVADEVTRASAESVIWKLVVEGVVVDVYLATVQSWGMTLLIRTGSAQHNVYLASKARAMGMAMKYSDGCFEKLSSATGKLEIHAYCPEEADVFKALGMPWVDPEDRERR